MSDRIILTDDEVVALAARVQKPWPSPVPSVDVADVSAVQIAAARGFRSLIARGLITDVATHAIDQSLDAMVRPVLQGTLMVATHLVDDSLAYSVAGLATAGYSDAGDKWVSEVITPDGSHYLQHESGETCRRLTRELVENAFTHGANALRLAGDMPHAAYLVAVHLVAADDRRSIAVTEGEGLALKLEALVPDSTEGRTVLASQDELVSHLAI